MHIQVSGEGIHHAEAVGIGGGFNNVRFGTETEAFLFFRFVFRGGQNDHGNRAESRMTLESRKCFPAVENRHVEIQDDQPWQRTFRRDGLEMIKDLLSMHQESDLLFLAEIAEILEDDQMILLIVVDKNDMGAVRHGGVSRNAWSFGFVRQGGCGQVDTDPVNKFREDERFPGSKIANDFQMEVGSGIRA